MNYDYGLDWPVLAAIFLVSLGIFFLTFLMMRDSIQMSTFYTTNHIAIKEQACEGLNLTLLKTPSESSTLFECSDKNVYILKSKWGTNIYEALRNKEELMAVRYHKTE